MRLVIDTNILVSALLTAASLPAELLVLWRAGRFDLLTTAGQLDELRRVTRYPKIRERLSLAVAGRLVNDLRALAVVIDLPAVLERRRTRTTITYWHSPLPGRQTSW